ncbi:MAG TPA: nuclear transport factor 2 family protein [Thermoanaerobaculia bacterium]|nr:nuclear transport factor 2 family protein [Thermoanaerobaculia bacterium]
MRSIFIATLVLASACRSAVPPASPAEGTDEFAISSTVIAAYNVVSGPAGRHDWDRMKELFAPGARVVSHGGASMSVDEFIAARKPVLEKEALFEQPAFTRIDVAGDMAAVLSTYESRHAANDATPYARGVRSVQLARIGSDWKIVTIFDEPESAAHPIPASLLPR